MKKKILVIGVALIMLCTAAAVVFAAISEAQAYTRGYREGYSIARSFQDWQKPIQKNGAWLVFLAGLSQEDKRNSSDLQYQFENGFEDGWNDQKAGNRPAK